MCSDLLFFRWDVSVIFCWDISVNCLTVVLKLAVTVFISVYFKTFWPKWLNFFGHFTNISACDRKMAERKPQVLTIRHGIILAYCICGSCLETIHVNVTNICKQDLGNAEAVNECGQCGPHLRLIWYSLLEPLSLCRLCGTKNGAKLQEYVLMCSNFGNKCVLCLSPMSLGNVGMFWISGNQIACVKNGP